MYILLEHSGTEDHLNYANKIQEYLEDEFGATVEQIVGGSSSVIVLYDDEQKRITELPINSDITLLSYYIEDKE